MNPIGAILLAVVHFSRVYVFCVLIAPVRSALGQIGMCALSGTLAVFFVMNSPTLTVNFAAYSGLQLTEVFLLYVFSGAIIALPLAFSVESLALGGRLVDLGRGAQLSEQFDPQAPERASAIETLLRLAAPACLFHFGMQFQVLSLLNANLASHEARLLKLTQAVSFQHELLRLGAETFLNGLLFAAPILISCFLLDLGLAFAARFLPRVSISFEVLPLKLWLGLLLLFLLGTHELLNTTGLVAGISFLKQHFSWMAVDG